MNYQHLIALEDALRSAGLLVDSIEHDKLTRCKTTEDRGRQRSGWYRVFEGAVTVAVFGDWRTGLRSVWVSRDDLSQQDRLKIEEQIRQAKIERQAAQERQYQVNTERLERLLNECKPLRPSDVAADYLHSRGLPLPHTSALMSHSRLPYWEGREVLGHYAALIGLVTDPEGKLVNIHRTYLSPKGKKADVPIVKKLSASTGSMAGASIKLGEPVSNSEGELMLGIAEGIETALAAAHLFGIPVWSCVSSHGLKSFTPPPEVKQIYIFGDNDKSGAGQKAASECGKRLARLGFSVSLVIPDSVGDWNDELIAIGAGV